MPQTATIEGRLAVPPGLTVEESLVRLKDHVYRITDQDPWLADRKPEITFGRTFWQPAQIPPDSPIVKVAGQAFENHFGRPPKVRGTPWGTDGRMLTQFAQTPSLVFGPGTSAHCPDEFLKIQDLIDFTKILLAIVVEWCGLA
ncbi:MAG: M20/M25/M40 family metallo-hydrolase [Deltaproteobacteria bacterium]|nr:M20/M25/M40 family metallo-hydrolase [Deltaproteobacteria bacterium]